MTAVLLLTLTMLVTAAWLLPGLNQPTLPFGVRIPIARRTAPVIGHQGARYRRQVAAASAVAAGAGLLTALTGQPWPVLAGGAVIMVVTALAYGRAHRAIAATKRAEGWYDGLPQATAVDTTLRTRPEPFPWRWLIPALVVVAATAAVGIVWYPKLPDLLAVHIDAAGVADRRVPRSVLTAFSPVFLQVLLTGLLVLVCWAGFHARADLDPGDPTAAGTRHRRFISGFARHLLVLTACVDASLAVVAWSIWSGGPTWTALALVGLAVAAGLIPLLAFTVRVGQGGSRLAEPEPASTGLNRRDDDRHWRLGLIYVNPEDPAVMVPQRVGVGWTLNLARPLSWVFLVALLLPAAAVTVLAVR